MDDWILFGVCLFMVAFIYLKVKMWIWFFKYEPIVADWMTRKLMKGFEWMASRRK